MSTYLFDAARKFLETIGYQKTPLTPEQQHFYNLIVATFDKILSGSPMAVVQRNLPAPYTKVFRERDQVEFYQIVAMMCFYKERTLLRIAQS